MLPAASMKSSGLMRLDCAGVVSAGFCVLLCLLGFGAFFELEAFLLSGGGVAKGSMLSPVFCSGTLANVFES